ncbi:MAG: oxidoreductase [Flavobacteriales bacterium]|jgi:NAD(P)-dependent dehydrogenase (short-subunit alcohol dehydrogenase family)|nr:oxidoreductase [Flavobacteriales bacterium]
MNWNPSQIPNQNGKTVLITGANTGLGFQTALEFAKKNASVIMAGRNEQKIQLAISQIKSKIPNAQLEAGIVDLSDLDSVKNFAQEILQNHEQLDILINNAGVMFPPASKTKQGYEMQFGVNFLSHFALTAHLYDLLNSTSNSRVVTLSSIAHKNGTIDFENLKLEKPYDKFREYGQSKVADLIFTIELQRRLQKYQSKTLSVAAHPGISKTELLRTDNPNMIHEFPHMTANQGAFSSLFAATEPISGVTYVGPNGEGEMTGFPAPAFIAEYAKSKEIGKKLWEYSNQELGTKFLL